MGWFLDLLDRATQSGASDPALGLAGGLAGAAVAYWALAARREAPVQPADDTLNFDLSDGRLTPRGREARRWLGEGSPAADVAGRLRALHDDADLSAVFAALEAEGKPFDVLAVDGKSRSWRIEGAPRRGRARVVMSPAGPDRLEAARQTSRAEAAERALADMQEMLAGSPDIAWRRAPDGRLCWANARYLEAAGGPDLDGAPRGLDFGGAGEPDLSEKPRRAAVFDAVSGRRRWFDLREISAMDGGRLGYGSDASAAISAEAALRRFVETLTETFAHLRVGLAIFDREMRLGLFNPAFSELMRLDPAWLAGRPGFAEVLDRLRDGGMLPEPEDFVDWRRGMQRMFGEADGRERLERTETWHLPGDTMIRVAARPHPQGAVALLFEDISETARLQRRWHTETDVRHAVMDRLEEGVAAFGADGQVRFANPAFARLWGFRPGGDGAPSAMAAVLDAFAARARPTEAWRRVAAFFSQPATRSPWSEEIELVDGRSLRLRVAALPDGSVLTAFSDISDAARAAHALRERGAALDAAQELRGALIEQASRRLRRPLNTIAGFGQMLRDGPECDVLTDRQRGYADGILAAAGQVQDTLGAVADLASAQAGAIALDASPVDLRSALTAAVEQARGAADRRAVRLRAEAPRADGGSAEVSADAARVRQILVNLLIDAAERAEAGALVRCGADRVGGSVEAWTEAPATAAELAGGAGERKGLALSLARRFAELHGGELRAEQVRRPRDLGDGAAALPFVELADEAMHVRVSCVLPSGESATTEPERQGGVAAA